MIFVTALFLQSGFFILGTNFHLPARQMVPSRIFFCIHFYLLCHFCFGQSDSIPADQQFRDHIESFVENIGEESDFDFNTLGETLESYLTNPIPINQAGFEELQALELLTDIQIAELISYRNQLGPLISIYELQSIPSFDLQSIERIKPFISIKNHETNTQISIPKMAIQGEHQIFLRWQRFLETKKGFQTLDGQTAKYKGDPNYLYLRYRYHNGNKMSYGFTAEKDPGEPFFSDPNRAGFDYYSFHFYLKDYSARIKYLALGDYTLSLGQGLIMHSGFGRGKSAYVMQIKKGGRTIRPYTSVNENAFLRGAALTMQFKPISLTLFGSFAWKDGNGVTDSLEQEPLFFNEFSSLQTSGLHRTEGEIVDKNLIRNQIFGFQIGLEYPHFNLHGNVVYNHFNLPFQRSPQVYNQFYFSGNSLINYSLDYTYLFKNLHFFGETALSSPGNFATLNGLLIGLSRFLDLSLLYRNVPRDYQGIMPNPFIESAQAINERGLYLGTIVKFSQAFWISIYADTWDHPWLTFKADAPSNGKEYLVRIHYYKKRKIDTYLHFKREIKGRNFRFEPGKINQIFWGPKTNLRWHLSHKLSPEIELRNRIEFSWAKEKPGPASRGFLLYQDLLYKPLEIPLSFTGRVAYFDTDNYSSRIYAYENDILYSFSIPAYYNQGFRYYLNSRIKWQKFTFEIRWEQTRFINLDHISSGNEQIDGNTRSRVKTQIRVEL